MTTNEFEISKRFVELAQTGSDKDTLTEEAEALGIPRSQLKAQRLGQRYGEKS